MSKRVFQWHPREGEAAFSLMEILTVIAMLAILTLLVVPSIRGISSSMDLSISGTTMVDTLNLARQTALSLNRPVQVRFFEVPGRNDTALAYRAVGIYVVGDTGPDQVGKLAFLHHNIVMSGTDAFGTLLRGLPSGEMALPSVDSGGAQKFSYRYFTFRPDGSAGLPSVAPVGDGDSWHVMLYDLATPPDGQTPPANHLTIQLLTKSGRTRTFRPGGD